MNSIEVNFVDHNLQKYDTCGDYYMEGDILKFIISKTGNTVYDRLVLIHEMVEQLLTEQKGIKEEIITDFDVNFKGDGEPGDDPQAPYADEHCFATGIEKMICAYLGIKWKEYDDCIEQL